MRPGFSSIRTTILASFLFLIIPVVLVIIRASISFTEDMVLDNSMDYTKQLIEQMNSEMDSYIAYMENISSMVTMNRDVEQFLTVDYEETGKKQELKQRILGQFKTILDTRADIVNIAVYGENGRYVLNYGKKAINPNVNAKDMEWYRKAVQANGGVVVSSSHVQNLVHYQYDWVVTLSCALKDSGTGEIIGALLVDLNYNVINNLCKKISLGNKGYIYLLDDLGGIVYHPKQRLIYHGLIKERTLEVMECKEDYFVTGDQEEKKIYMIARSMKTGWTAVGVANVSELFTKDTETKGLYIGMAILLLLASALLSLLLAGIITKPVKKLRDSMKEVEKGNFHVILGYRGKDEIAMLGNAYDKMVVRIAVLMEERIRDQELKRKSELRALQAQINPHFLYNTLDSIVWMAEEGRSCEVVTMTVSLAKLLRQSISNEAEEVTVKQEVEYVRNYLVIQKMRYQEQLNYEIKIPSQIQFYPMIKLILQPLVENALYHGVKYKDSIGKILIDGYEEGDHVILRVIDDGIGMSPEKLAHIFDKSAGNAKSNHVAVWNIQNRIRLHYGEQYGLCYESEEGVGTIVQVVLPKKREEDKI